MKYNAIHRNRSIVLVRSDYDDAKYIFVHLGAILQYRKVVTENDLRDLIGLPSHVEGTYWGWRNLDGMHIDGHYQAGKSVDCTVTLPKMISLVTMEIKDRYFPSFTIGNKNRIGNSPSGHLEIEFKTREDAEETRQALFNLLAENKEVTLSDVYDMVGEPWLSVDDDLYFNYGWLSLAFLHIVHVAGRVSGRNVLLCFPSWIKLHEKKKHTFGPIPDEMHTVPFTFVATDGSTFGVGKTMTLKDIEEFSKSGEEFELKTDSYWHLHKILENEFMYVDNRLPLWRKSKHTLCELLSADFRRKSVVEGPWKPKAGERYWAMHMRNGHLGHKFHHISHTWEGNSFDLMCLHIGNCFHTEEDCLNNREIISTFNHLEKEYQEK